MNLQAEQIVTLCILLLKTLQKPIDQSIVFFLCFSASIGYNLKNGDPLSVWYYFTKCDSDFLHSDFTYSAYNVAATRGGDWFSLFVPMISALCFVNVLCDEKTSHYIRYEVHRTGYFKFGASQFISSLFTSGLSITIGYGAFIIFSILNFPHLASYSEEIRESIFTMYSFSGIAESIFQSFGIASLYLLLLAEMFLYGMLAALPALLIVSFTNNKYLIVCIPFLAKYFVTQLSII